MTAALFFHAAALAERLVDRDPFEKPAEPEDCGACDGVGRVANEDAESLMTPMWVDCRTCEGAGTLPEPDLNPRPFDVDACTACGGQGARLVLVDGEQVDETCGWCAGTGQRGVA